MSKKVKALFAVVSLSATFIILFQMCVITLDPRSCPMDIQRQYLHRYSQMNLITARAQNSTHFANLTPTLNMATLLKLNGSTELLQSSVAAQLTVSLPNAGTSSDNSNGSAVPGGLPASMEPTTSRTSISTTYTHTVVTEEPPQSIATVLSPLPHAYNEIAGSMKSLQSADTQLDAVGNPVRPSSHPHPPASSEQITFLNQPQTQRTLLPQRQTRRALLAKLKTQRAFLPQWQTQGTSLAQPQAQRVLLPQQRTSLAQPQAQRALLPQRQTQRTSLAQPQTQRKPKKQCRSKRCQRNTALLRGPLPTGVSPALNLSSIAYLPLPRMGAHLCQDRLCTEVLTPVDLLYFNYCTDRQKHAKTEIYRDTPLGRCHFIDGRNRTVVALVSFPGSGNTWVRGLLEQATGICTGAIYCDVSLRASGFNGEGVKSGAVLVVKTHSPNPEWTESNMSTIIERGHPKYGSGIMVIRNPFDALVADWNRGVDVPRGNGTNRHVNCVGREFFGDNAKWNESVTRRVELWQSYFYNWLMNNMSKPILVVRFEDLKTDLIGQVKRMLDFLQFPYLEDELRSRLAEGFGKFRRVHDGDDFEHFTAKQRELIRTVVLETIGTLRQHGQNLFGLTDYLHSNL